MDAVHKYLLSTGEGVWAVLMENSGYYDIDGVIIMQNARPVGDLTLFGWRRVGSCIYCDDHPTYKFTYDSRSNGLLAAFILTPKYLTLFNHLHTALGLLNSPHKKIEFTVVHNQMSTDTMTTFAELRKLPDPFWDKFKIAERIRDEFKSGRAGWYVSDGEIINPLVAPHLRFPLTERTKWVIGTFVSVYDIGFDASVVPHLTKMYEIVTGLIAPQPINKCASKATIDGVSDDVINILTTVLTRDTLVKYLAVYKKFANEDDATGTVNAATLKARINLFLKKYNDAICRFDYFDFTVIGNLYVREVNTTPSRVENDLAKLLLKQKYGEVFRIPNFGPECAEVLRVDFPGHDPKLLV